MHVGLSVMFQNMSGEHTDYQAIEHGLWIADQAEARGYDSVWSPEHHFSNYTMDPNPTQFLTWLAGRTSRIRLGSMVTVMPWHDPVRAAEQWAWLDQVSGGRAILGVGRGLGAKEFHGFRLNMGESRPRFTEYTDALARALETGYMEYDGEFYRQPRVPIRPFPTMSFRGRIYASAISPQSMKIMANLGIGLMIIAQKPWDTIKEELKTYNEVYSAINGAPPPKPLLVAFFAVDHSAAAAAEMAEQYILKYSMSAAQHYEFANVGLADIPGYEYYGALAKTIENRGLETFARFLSELQTWGTPEQVTEQLLQRQRDLDIGGLIMVPSYGGMPFELAERNLDLFTREVLPHLKAAEPHDGVLSTPASLEIGKTISPAFVSADPVEMDGAWLVG